MVQWKGNSRGTMRIYHGNWLTGNSGCKVNLGIISETV